MNCQECSSEMRLAAHPIVVRIGSYQVECKSIQHDRCSSCGYYELSAKDGELLDIRASLVVLEQKPAEPKVVHFARKALGLTQTELAKELGAAQETISRYETGRLPIPSAYFLELSGLLAAEERRLLGTPDSCKILAQAS